MAAVEEKASDSASRLGAKDLIVEPLVFIDLAARLAFHPGSAERPKRAKPFFLNGKTHG
ncbi:hypothetical protein [Pseudomonas sp. Q1-7]|uniref:hypothetical protein n=1 Tax=Pseudomonas sp. Q1-7 TaxID=3020843 RepID=UPI0023016976|nr:hypothetical protein [Pseudomonas sp. Q1-7]